MVVNARKEADIIHPETKTPLELDIFLPSLHLAFEYQVFTPFHYLLQFIINCTESMNKKG